MIVPDASLPVTARQLEELRTRGFLRLDSIIDRDELAWLRDLFATLFSGAPSDDPQLASVEVLGSDSLPQAFQPSAALPALLALSYCQRLQEIASFLLGQPAQFLYDHMICKPARCGGPTPWHQDQAYLDPAFRYTSINFWLPLEDATTENGCMHYVAGSHLRGVVPHRPVDITDRQSALVAADLSFCEQNATPVPCPAGSAVLHHSYTLHYSGPNRSERPRQVYLVVCGLPPVPLASLPAVPGHALPERSEP